jgi:hypothetical protein
MRKPDPVEIVAIAVPVIAEAVAVVLFHRNDRGFRRAESWSVII